LAIPDLEKRRKKTSFDNGYYSGGRPSTVTPPAIPIHLEGKGEGDQRAEEKATVDGLRECLLNLILPSVRISYWGFASSTTVEQHS